jgi:hypothetical protein
MYVFLPNSPSAKRKVPISFILTAGENIVAMTLLFCYILFYFFLIFLWVEDLMQDCPHQDSVMVFVHYCGLCLGLLFYLAYEFLNFPKLDLFVFFL